MSTTEIPAAPAAPAQSEGEEQVELDCPIRRGDSLISSVSLRRPLAGELRGVSLAELANLDVQALRKVLPRITTPTLTDHEVGNLDPADLTDLGLRVAGFLLKKKQREQVSLAG